MHEEESSVAWQGTSWRLRVVRYRLPDGSALEKGHVEHPGAVVLVPLRETAAGPEVIMLRQYRTALKQTILELPAGTRGWDEDWELCAQRELQEEIGFRAGKLAPLGTCWPAPGHSNELMKLYLATELVPDPLPQDADEMITPEANSFAEALEMAEDGRLQDAKSVVGILRTAKHLRHR